MRLKINSFHGRWIWKLARLNKVVFSLCSSQGFIVRCSLLSQLSHSLKCSHSKIFDFAAKAKAPKCDIHELCYLHYWTKHVVTKLHNTLKSLKHAFFSLLPLIQCYKKKKNTPLMSNSFVHDCRCDRLLAESPHFVCTYTTYINLLLKPHLLWSKGLNV